MLRVCCAALLIVLTFLLPTSSGAATSSNTSSIRPLQTELIAPLDITHVHIGSPVLLRVDVEWIGANCILRTGSIIQGHVVGLMKRSKGSKDSQIQLSFEAADCEAHHEVDFPFTLVSLIGPAEGNGQSGVSEAPPLSEAIGNTIGGAGGGIRSAATASGNNSAAPLPNRKLPAQILPGQVIDLRKTSLSIGAGVGASTTVTATGHDLRLEQGTSLILTHSIAAEASTPQPERKGSSMSGAVGGGSELVGTVDSKAVSLPAASAPRATPAPQDESELCSDMCNIVGDVRANPDTAVTAASSTLALKSLGYSPRENREMRAFDEETTLTFLNDANLLCTFDPHRLRERSGSGDEEIRRIRAVLINPQTHSVKRVLEWQVRGGEEYLWRFAEGQVLVHMSHELKLLNADLKQVRSIRVDGPVAWVTSAPSGSYFAVGTIRERHSAVVHQDLEAALNLEPEEDVNVRVFDKSFSLVASAVQTSRTPIPVLSESGELRLHGDGHTHWKVTEIRWDRTEQTVASLRSACRPQLSTSEGDLIFAVGCTTSGGRWYRMLRRSGRPLLKGESSSDEIQQSALGAKQGAFAVRVVKANRAMSYDQPFKKADLVQEKISVYRSSDGKALSTVNTAAFSLSQMAFALSPSGSELALVGDDSVMFYTVNLAQN